MVIFFFAPSIFSSNISAPIELQKPTGFSHHWPSPQPNLSTAGTVNPKVILLYCFKNCNTVVSSLWPIVC
jgi:hypothetical protein